MRVCQRCRFPAEVIYEAKLGNIVHSRQLAGIDELYGIPRVNYYREESVTHARSQILAIHCSYKLPIDRVFSDPDIHNYEMSIRCSCFSLQSRLARTIIPTMIYCARRRMTKQPLKSGGCRKSLSSLKGSLC
jgi:hypothetical protein